MRTMLGAPALLAVLSTGALVLPPASSASGGPPYASKDYGLNLLRNGGFIDWPFGLSTSIPPGDWYPNGVPANTFAGTTFLDIERVPGVADCTRGLAGGAWAVELRVNVPGSFLSQRIRDFGELRCKTVTVSAFFMTPFVVASPTLTLDDGVGSSSDTRTLVIGNWQMLSTTLKVAQNATKLEVRIDPGSSVRVDDVQLVLGDQPRAPYAPRGNAEQGLDELPLGVPMDWMPMHPSMPLPYGFAICDGSTITDPESPFFGKTLPNLDQRVVRGTTSTSEVGQTGGSHTHVHTVPSNSDTWLIVQFPPPPFLTALRGDTTHTTSSASSWPPYIKMLKIMRIQ